MSKVGIIGDKDSIMGFLALGIDIFPAYTPEEIKKTIHNLAEKEYAIIYITEQASLQAGESLAKYKDFELPAIIVIPGIGGRSWHERSQRISKTCYRRGYIV